MSDQIQSNRQQTIVIALVVIAVLLAALVGVLIYQQAQAAKLAQLSAAPQTTAGATTGNSAMGSNAAAAAVPFDVKTATKVPSGMTPEQLVKSYNENVVGGKYDAAFKLLPYGVQKNTYGDATKYAEQLKGYGISGYKMGKPTTSGDTMSIAAEQQTSAMGITYTWTFKKVGGQWYVESRTMGGSVN